MSNTKERRHFTGQEKVVILRRHLVERDRKLAAARERRRVARQQVRDKAIA